MKLLVTGGSGFVGSHVVEALKSKGHDVLIFDIQPPQNKDGFFRGDLTKLEDLLQATQGIDVVCHLAAVGDVYLAFEKPYLAAELNVTGTANLMEACLRNGVQKVIYASTWEVYGEPVYQPVDEQHPCNPDHPYNITKLAGERMALAYDRLKGVPTIALRLGTSYGERMRPNSVFSIFIRRAMNEEPLTIKGGGMQSRQFTHARDIGLAFARAIETPVRGEVFNVVTPESTSIKRLAELVLERLPTEITYEEARVGDVPPARVSAQKAKEVLGWEASVPFEQGLTELIEAYLRA